MKKLILITILMFVIITTTTQAGFLDWAKNLFNENLGIAVRTFMPSQGGTGISSSTASNEGKYLKVSSTTPNLIYSFDTPAGGAGGGSTTTIAGLKPDTDIFFLTSTSGINITTSSPATIQFNLGIATTTELAITDLAGQTGCLSVSATGIVATSTCSGGTGITSLGGQTGGTQTFATSSDTNIGLEVGSAGDIHTLTSKWIGTLADGRITSANTWNAKITTSSLSMAYPPLAYNNTTGVFTLPTSTASQSGFLSSADWTTFNNKVATTSPFTTGYIPYATSNLTITNSSIFQSGNNIGIGTT